jgi:hypothetical protein
MKRKLLLVVVILSAVAAFADIEGLCMTHPWASCYDTGQEKYRGDKTYAKYHCTCGDDAWVLKQ